MRAFVAALAVILLLPTVVLAAKPVGGGNDPFVWTLQNRDVAGLVEQQSSTIYYDCPDFGADGCVWNPTAYGPTQYGQACLWDIDDNFMVWATEGILAVGTTTFTQCRIADSAYKLTGLILRAKSPDLVVTIGFATEGVTFQLMPKLVDREYEYRGCVRGPIYSDAVQGVPIEGSYGGWGVPTSVVLSVTNDTDRAIRGALAQAVSGISTPARLEYCRTMLGERFKLGGAVWQTGL